MSLNFRAMAALCSVAVSLSSGCESVRPVDTGVSGTMPPLFSSENISGQEIIPSCAPGEEDFVPAEAADRIIEISADSVKISGGGAAVRDGNVVISDGGAYVLSGSGEQRILLESDEDVSLILDGVQLNAPIECSTTAQLKLTLRENSENSLNALYSPAGIISSGDIIINGSGSLYISGDRAIDAAGAVKLCGGDVELSAQLNGVVGSAVICAGSVLGIQSGADGILAAGEYGCVSISAGTVDITSDGNAITAEGAVAVSGGEVRLSCGGGSSAVLLMESGGKYPYGRHGGYYTNGDEEYDFDKLVSGDATSPVGKKGIISGRVQIDGGVVDIDSADDSISAAEAITINGGELHINSGDDGLRADGCITITDGTLNVEKSYTAIEALSVDIEGGMLQLMSYRDGIKAAGGNDIGFSNSDTVEPDRYISISGGSIAIDAGGDGIDTGGTAAMSGGEVVIYSENDVQFGSMDYDDSFALSGGMLAAFGSAGLTKAPSMVSVPCLSVKAELSSGAEVSIADDDGNVLFSTVLPKACSTVVFSCDALEKGDRYHVLADGVEIVSVTALQGVSGDGPNGRGGVVDNMTESNPSGGVVA